MRTIHLLAIILLAAAPLPPQRADRGADEARRLRAHFDSVDVELRNANTDLGQSQRTSRAKLIDWLRDYRHAGRFPHNDRFRQPTPFFRDSRGELCAMAYLIERSGRGDLVDRIARTRNNAFIAELAGDEQLVRWLDSVGLSVTEAGRIQPAYGCNGTAGFGCEDRSSVSTSYALLSIAVSGTAATTMGFNILRPSTASGALGLLLGGAAVITGLARMPSEGSRHTVAVTNIAVGSGAVILGFRGLVEAANRRARDKERRHGLGLVFLPALVRSGRPALGFVAQARF